MVIVGGTPILLITMLKALVALPAIFSAITVKLNVPAVVGVPEITPAAPFKPNPEGRLPLAKVQVIGVVPVAARV